jgi:hypothetical protein
MIMVEEEKDEGQIEQDLKAQMEKDVAEQLGQQMRSVARLKFIPVESSIKCVFDDKNNPVAHTIDFDRNPTEVYALQHMNGLISFFYVQEEGSLLPIGVTTTPIPWDFGKLLFIKEDDDDIIEGGIQ